MKEKVLMRENMVEERDGKTFTLNYYRLTVVDATGRITNDILEDLFVAFSNGFLDLAVKELKQKERFIKVEEKLEDRCAKVIITKRHFWEKKN